MDLVTVAESGLSASRCVHSHFVSTFCQLTQLQHFLGDNFPLQTGHMKNKHANKEIFTAHYGDLVRTRRVLCQDTDVYLPHRCVLNVEIKSCEQEKVHLRKFQLV